MNRVALRHSRRHPVGPRQYPLRPFSRRLFPRLAGGLRLAGVRVVVPEIADYEVRRELLRVNASSGLLRLDALVMGLIYARITTDVMRQASHFWADVRKRGMPTAANASLDADAILAAQALLLGDPGDLVELATGNVSHLNRFPGVNSRD